MIYRDMSENEYGQLEGIRASWVKTLARSTPAHLEVSMREREESDALRVGSALHDSVLLPEVFSKRWVSMPKLDRRTKDGKAMYEALVESAALNQQQLLTEQEAEMVHCVTSSVFRTNAAQLLTMCRERELVVTGEIAGVPCKARIDACDLHTGLVVDIKTTVSAAPRAFTRSVVEYGYLMQMAFYRELLQQNGAGAGALDATAVLVACEKTAPYGVALYEVRSDDMDRVMPAIELLVQRIARCMEMNDWPCYSPLVQPLQLPEWAFASSGEEALL